MPLHHGVWSNLVGRSLWLEWSKTVPFAINQRCLMAFGARYCRFKSCHPDDDNVVSIGHMYTLLFSDISPGDVAEHGLSRFPAKEV